ncbi:RecA-like DNA recombinase [Mycobacterium phage Rope]|uniref:RecA-like DNA recombinase n=8 Tax=Papyrusvirus TaxID=1982554 RepID=A0A0Y0AEL6_9CAUD|nr:RecA-like DNA recombinase [Mycobacterium phage Papyrus]YP_009614295.1 nucleotide binding protein [Mycobacterium phage Send513]AMB17284.1 RecA-like DNA recombinase [Mycobacterium phage Weiss13]ARW57157.1 RecA-like DNA recombinase [Mycobacterium phage Zenon]AVO21469.1 RecA-like DNA recombinase [Mycobacterium phage Nilo]AYQ98644.1 RecA-like DNA recombinase [Mycobacterium phage Riparian]QCG78175.1 RecA-like DNA recombinase [Mycobacterium phage Candle]QNN99729.1 RecA-like DNA recombinase [Myco
MPTWDEAVQDPDIVALDAISPHPNFMVYGASGCGKTVLGGSDDKVLFLTCEPEGCISAKRMGSNARQVIIHHWDQLEEWYDKLSEWAEDGTGIPFNWIVIDTISDAQGLLFDKLLDEKGLDVEDWPTYRKNQKILLRYVKKMNQLPVNLLWLAWDRKETDADGEDFFCPEIHGKGYSIAMQVAAQMTSYGYMQVRTERKQVMKDGKAVVNPKTKKPRTTLETHRYIYWQDIQSLRGKDRTMALAPFTKDLTLRDIRLKVEKAFAGEAEKTDEKVGN